MTAELRPYPEYKESGLPWLGRVPAHWDVRRAKYMLREQDQRCNEDVGTLLSVSQYTGVTKRRLREGSEEPDTRASSLVGYRVVAKNDLVVNIMLAWNGSLGVAPSDGIVSPAYCVYRFWDGNAWYFHHLLRSPSYRAEIKRRSRGVVDSRLRLYTDDLFRIPIIEPPRNEQEVIIKYLDLIDRRINRFIRNRRRLIEVLNEQKQAIINRAVTRGLDPNVPLKPSGIDWLGDIPEHWEEKRLRNLVELRVSNVDKYSKDGELPVRLCNYTDVYKNSVITADMPFMAATATRDEIAAFHIRVGDVIITKDSEDWQDIGVPAVVVQTADNLVCGYHLAILRPKTSFITGHFLAYAMQCRSVVTQLNLAAKGVTRYGLSQGAIKSLSLAVPTVDEQKEIVLYIEEATASLNELVKRAQREIDLIREYRTRLIADMVTGKLDVRHLALETAETAAIIKFPEQKKQTARTANVYFKRAVFAAEIVARLHKEPTFGHVKFEKLIFLCEKKCGVDIGSTYYRQAAGPYDNRALRSIDSQIKKQKWFAVQKVDKRYQYIPLANTGGHKTYFGRYYADVEDKFSDVIETFRTLNTQRCEIVATLYAAWEDLLAQSDDVTDDQIVEQVLHHWHTSKQQIDKDRWRKAIGWMKKKGLTPRTGGSDAID